MGTFDELANSGKDFAMLLSALQEGKDKDTDSLTSSEVSIRTFLPFLFNDIFDTEGLTKKRSSRFLPYPFLDGTLKRKY